MVSLLLAIIYLAFISLGLPDSLLGSAWPVMHQELDVPLAYMGIVTIIISSGTIISSLLSDKLTRIFKTGLVTAVSTLLTAGALFLFSIATDFWMLCLIAIPYGLGAGAIDSALNNYVALHYSGRSMSFLHCFWGIGAIISPNVMSYALTNFGSYPLGYRTVFFIQTGLALVLILTLPIWNKVKDQNGGHQEVVPAVMTFKQKFRIDGIYFILFGFFAYCAMEATLMVWTPTFLVKAKGLEPAIAAAYGSFFYLGMTISRFITGLITNRVGDKNMIRIGSGVIFIGLILVFIPVETATLALVGFIVLGLGCGPIYPAIIHSTPRNFGKENSQAIIGLQMASAYTGATLMPPVYGLLANFVSPKLLPVHLTFFFIIMTLMIELLNKKVTSKKKPTMENMGLNPASNSTMEPDQA